MSWLKVSIVFERIINNNERAVHAEPISAIGCCSIGPERAQARAHSAGSRSGFYYITQKPEPARAWFLG
jgi:hypothetical protein